MYNFISTFDELSKLYEEANVKKAKQDEKIEEACKEELTEAAEDKEIEIVDGEAAVEEIPAEEPVVEDEPKQTIVECAKCGALVIVDEVEVDEESDLVNVKDECKFCEEKEGYKIIGSVLPYEAPEADEVVEEEIPEEPVEDELAEEDDIVEEDLADVARKVFDKPASIKTQQAWEDELNGEMGEISDKRRKHLERKFAQQRDWEARHTTEVTEDVKAGEAETAVAGTTSAGAAETHVAGREELPDLPDLVEESLAMSPELETEIKDLIGLYADKLDISSSSDNPNVPSGQVQICTFVRSEASKTAHKEMIDILKKAGYKVVSDFDAGVNPLIKAHMSYITITK